MTNSDGSKGYSWNPSVPSFQKCSCRQALHDAFDGTIQFWAENTGAGQARDEMALGLRSFPVSRYRNYLGCYRAIKDGIQIIRVLHGARDLARF